MRQSILALSATLVVLLGLSATAEAQSPALTLPKVERIASHALAVAVEDQNALAVEYGDPVVNSYRLGECDLETSHRAVCDYTVIESDGTIEDGALEVWASARHVGVRWLD